MNIKSLSSRIKKLEKNKIKVGIPAWCIEEAKKRAFMDSFRYRNLLILSEQIDKKEVPCPKIWNDEEISQYALDLSRKYSHYSEYLEKRPSMNLKKLQAIIAKDKKTV